MAMIKCPECGKEISDKAEKCPNCGCPITTYGNKEGEIGKITQEIINKYNKDNKQRANMIKELRAATGMGLKEAVDEIDKFLNPVNTTQNKKKHTGLWIALAIIAVLIIIAIPNSNEKDEKDLTSQQQTDFEGNQDDKQQGINNKNDTEAQKQDSNVLKVGSSFEKGGLKITVNDADIEFTDYEDEYGWYKPQDGMKYIMASFTFENSGKSDAYVSIYDFKCYADNTTCEQAYLLDDNKFVNTNLSPGRNISFKTYYQVPVNANSIELEYETNVWTNKKAIIKLQ